MPPNRTKMKPALTIKHLLLSHHLWWHFYEKHRNHLRIGIVIAITKLLSCKNTIRGYHLYHCSQPTCPHVKRIPHTCKCKACSSCGKKATELWIAQQNHVLPHTAWQHITFTLPSELWDFFWCNRELLNRIAPLAAHCVKTIADKKRVIPGMFVAIHTFGRDLKRNVHIHLSVTTGGLSLDGKQWKKLFFHQATLMRLWRYQIIRLFHQKQSSLILPPAVKKQLHHAFTLNQFLNQLYQKTWIVHCSKPSDDPKLTINYLARYLKRPPIAESKLKHYDGNLVMFSYLDHKTKTYRQFKLSKEEFIGRFIQHIPDQGFRMIRYYGFLAHRVRGTLLPLVYPLLNQENNRLPSSPSFAALIQKNFHFDPLVCILCGSPLILSAIQFGLSTAQQLFPFHRQLALLQKF